MLACCRAVEHGPATAFTLTSQAANHERVGDQSRREIDDPVEFQIVLLHRAGEPRPDGVVAVLVEGEPGALELEDGSSAIVEVGGGSWAVVAHVGHSLHRRPTGSQASNTCTFDDSVAPPTAGSVRPMPGALGRPFLIGVAGGTCSGKTTVSERLAEMIGAEHLALIKLDSYYVRRSHLSLHERAVANYDHPDAFDWELLDEHLAALAAGETVPVPVYDYAQHDRSTEVRSVHPAHIVVVEGILVLYEPRLRDRFDLRVYIDTDADIRLIRRLQRDVAERGRTTESIIGQYLETVRPSHEQFVEPSKRHADVIFPQGGMNEPALDVLLARVRELAGLS